MNPRSEPIDVTPSAVYDLGQWMYHEQKELPMKISNVASTDTHDIQFFEFLTPDGVTITSFFQVVAKPNISLGCVDTYQEALDMIGYSSDRQQKYVEQADWQSFGIGESDSLACFRHSYAAN